MSPRSPCRGLNDVLADMDIAFKPTFQRDFQLLVFVKRYPQCYTDFRYENTLCVFQYR